MKTILISIMMLFALQSKASVTDSLTEVRINNNIYIGHIDNANDSTMIMDAINIISVGANKPTVIYVNGNAIKIKKVIITDLQEPVIEVKYIDLKLNK